MDPRQPRPHLADKTADKSAQSPSVAEAIRIRRWRQRRLGYLMMTLVIGVGGPSISLALAGAINAGSFGNWITVSGSIPLVITMVGGLVGALLVFLRGWGVSLGMITYGVLFIMLISITRSVSGSLLPAMPGLVALFVSSGALVGYLTVLEEGD